MTKLSILPAICLWRGQKRPLSEKLNTFVMISVAIRNRLVRYAIPGGDALSCFFGMSDCGFPTMFRARASWKFDGAAEARYPAGESSPQRPECAAAYVPGAGNLCY